jgi:hypothetical protein
VSAADCFRIGTIGDLRPDDVRGLLKAVAEVWPAGAGATANGAAANGAAAPAAGPPAGAEGTAVKAAVFDWAGTTIDYGSRAPLLAFLDMFRCGWRRWTL